MKKILILVLCMVYANTRACDVCGCKLGGLYFGILPQFDSHFIGLRYSRADFRAAMRYNSEYLEDETSKDNYQRIDLLGRYALSSKWQVSFIVPYLVNEMEGSHQTLYSNGLGDPMVVLNYQLFNNNNDFTSKWKHTLLVGAGLKFPLGDFTEQSQGEIINRNFQLGSGSLDYLLSSTYTLSNGTLGINIESGYKLNSANSDGYRFGNQFNISGYFFYGFDLPTIAIAPYTGIYYESAQHHDNNGFEEMNTGGHATFSAVGIQLNKGNFTLNGLFQIPINQQFNSETIAEIEAENRWSVNLLFNIFKKNNARQPIPIN